MLRITRSIFICNRDNHFFKNVEKCVVAKGAFLQSRRCYCHTKTLVNQEEERYVADGSGISKTADNSENNEVFEESPRSMFSGYAPFKENLKSTTNLGLSSLEMIMNEGTFENLRKLSLKNSVRAFYVFSQKNFRSLTALKILSENVLQSSHRLTVKECSDILYNIARLNFQSKDLLDGVAAQLLNLENHVEGVALPSHILKSTASLRYRNTELINLMLKVIIKNKEEENSLQSKARCLLSIAHVNFSSPLEQFLLQELIKLSHKDFTDTFTYFNFVWSCVLLNEFPPHHISYALSQDFFDMVQGNMSKFNDSVMLKMLKTRTAVTALAPSIDCKFFEEPCLPDLPIQKKSLLQKSRFLTSVVDGLGYIFPKNGFCNTNVNVGGGFLLDIECCVDSSGNPVPLLKKNGAHKIGIMLISYHDVCLDDEKTLLGECALKKKVFEAKGYKVLTILYSDFDSNLKISEKVEYLKKCLQETVSKL